MSCVPKDPFKKYEHSSIPYQSNSEIDVINWYGNLMFIWFCPPKVFFAKYKKDIQMYFFYELLHYQNDSNIKNSAKEMILKVILTCYYFL